LRKFKYYMSFWLIVIFPDGENTTAAIENQWEFGLILFQAQFFDLSEGGSVSNLFKPASL
jgi:hypothetical protein